MISLTATIEIWGNFALWTRPESKVERLSYPVPTPSGIRGMLASIYSKPPEFYWQVKRIEVLKPIRYISFKRNEVKSKLIRIPDNQPQRAIISIEDDRTQRQSIVLQDVRYRITAEIIPRPEFHGTAAELFNQFERRVRRGQAFAQPCMGVREFPAYFEWGSSGIPAIPDTQDFGLMVYDTFDLNEYIKPRTSVSLYRVQMRHGVIEVPPYASQLVLKPGGGCRSC
jgi:CRISPR-associated protein Cas5d